MLSKCVEDVILISSNQCKIGWWFPTSQQIIRQFGLSLSSQIRRKTYGCDPKIAGEWMIIRPTMHVYAWLSKPNMVVTSSNRSEDTWLSTSKYYMVINPLSTIFQTSHQKISTDPRPAMGSDPPAGLAFVARGRSAPTWDLFSLAVAQDPTQGIKRTKTAEPNEKPWLVSLDINIYINSLKSHRVIHNAVSAF